jgi:hypothetical protein
MHNDYRDIRERIAEPPGWWDEAGVPRYGAFAPVKIWNVYAREVALMKIACQACGTLFEVALSSGRAPEIADAIRSNELHYGDPPNTGCCVGGDTMNSTPLRVLGYWRRDQTTGFEWQRDRSLEVAIKADRAQDNADGDRP